MLTKSQGTRRGSIVQIYEPSQSILKIETNVELLYRYSIPDLDNNTRTKDSKSNTSDTCLQ